MNSSETEASPANPRIAFLHQDLWVGGSTVFLINLAGDLVRRGIPVHVYSLAETHSLRSDFERRHIPVSSERTRGTIFEDRILGALRRMASFSPTAVVASIDPGTCEVMRHLPPRVFRVGVIHAFNQVASAVPYAGTMDCLVTVSEHLRNLVANQSEFSRLPVQCVELGIPIPSAIHRPSLISNRRLRILYLGRLENPAKRVRLFPEILDRLKATGIPFDWTIAGEGPERPFLQKEMDTNDENQRVRFTGLLPYSDVPALLDEHDILLLTSDTEVFPLSLHEGMAAGLVPVVSDLAGRIREIVTDDAGLRVSPSNTPAYAEAIRWLHEHRVEMQKMSSQARGVIGQKYSVEAMTDRWLAVLRVLPPKPPVWPERWELLPPLFPSRRWWFSKPVRWLRRRIAHTRWRLFGSVAGKHH